MGVCSLGQWQWKRTVLFEDDSSVPDAEKITHRFASLKKKKPTDRMHFYYVGLEHKKPSLYVFYLWKGSENCFEIPTYVTQMYLHFHPLSKWLFSRTMHSGMLVDISQLTLKKKNIVAFANTPTMANLKLSTCCHKTQSWEEMHGSTFLKYHTDTVVLNELQSTVSNKMKCSEIMSFKYSLPFIT